jgi:hypothetical protein
VVDIESRCSGLRSWQRQRRSLRRQGLRGSAGDIGGNQSGDRGGDFHVHVDEDPSSWVVPSRDASSLLDIGSGAALTPSSFRELRCKS